MQELGLSAVALAGPQAGSGNKARVPLLLLKVGISLAFLVIVILSEDPRELWLRVKQADPLLIAAAVLLLLLQFPLAGYRWRLVLKSLGYEVRANELTRLVWIGQFLSQVLPTFIAGDGVRVWYCRQGGMPLRLAFSSILWDRALGFGGLAVLSLIMAPRLGNVAPGSAAATAVPLVAGAATIGIFSLMLAGHFAGKLPERFSSLRLLAPFRDGWELLRRPNHLGVILFLATATNVLASVAAWLLARSLDIDFSLLDSITLVPAALFASLLPISIAGWGVREVTLAYLLPLVGVASSDAVALSLVLGGALMFASLPGLPLLYQSARAVEPELVERSPALET